MCCQLYCKCVCLCVCVTSWPWIPFIVIKQAQHLILSLSQIIYASPKTITATQLLFGFSPGQVLSVHTTTSRTTQLVDCFCLLTLLPSLPGSPGWPGTPANPWGKRTCIIVNWVLHSCSVEGRDYSLLSVKNWCRQMFVPHVLNRPVDN